MLQGKANYTHVYNSQMKPPKQLDAIADVVLAYRPKAKAKASKQRQKRRGKVLAYPSGAVRSLADQIAAGAVIPRQKRKAKRNAKKG